MLERTQPTTNIGGDMKECHKCSLLSKVNELLMKRSKLHRDAADVFQQEVKRLKSEIRELGF